MNKSQTPTEEEVRESLTEVRTAEFKSFLDYCEEQEINFMGPEWKQISEFATKEEGINLSHSTSDLSNLQVDKLTSYEWIRILKRARTGVKRIVEMRTKWAGVYKKNSDGTFALDGKGEKVRVGTAGPYYTNRKTKRIMMKNIIKHARASQRPLKASDVIKRIKEKKSVYQPAITA